MTSEPSLSKASSDFFSVFDFDFIGFLFVCLRIQSYDSLFCLIKENWKFLKNFSSLAKLHIRDVNESDVISMAFMSN